MANWLRKVPALLRTQPGRRRLFLNTFRPLIPLLRFAARLYRRTLVRHTRVVAVVGSFGKTTMTRSLATVLCGGFHRFAGNNTAIFIAHAVLRVRPRDRHAVVEVGITKPGQMAGYARTVRPSIAVVTSIGTEHHRSLGTLEVTRAEKGKMVEALPADGLAVLNGDDPHALWMGKRTPARVVTFGLGPANDFRATDVVCEGADGTRFLLHSAGAAPQQVRIRLLGHPGVRTALATLAVGICEGVPREALLSDLARLEPTPGRLEPVRLANGALLLRDEFKSSYETVETALDVLAEFPARRRVCVLGDVSEPPGSQGPLYGHLGERVARIADKAIFIGDARRRYATGARRAGMPSSSIVRMRLEVQKAIDLVREDLGPGDVVLVKGRDTQRLDRISLALMGHEVRCAIRFCDAKGTRCHHCKMLTTGWGDGPVVI